MKKLYTQKKWKTQSRRRQEDELARRKRRNKLLHQRVTKPEGVRQYNRRGTSTIRRFHVTSVPENFSLIENTEEVIEFFERVRRMFSQKWNVEIDLSKTKNITTDAIVVLVSLLKDNRFTRGRPYRGNEPEDETLKERFTESGFYNYVKTSNKLKNPDYGSIRARAKHKVDGTVARDIIKFATEKMFGKHRKCGGVYKTLLESMNNTRDHASGNRIHRERWWAAVHYDKIEKKARFTFVDNGVGIFKSRGLDVLLESLRLLRLKSNTGLIQKMLRGEIESSTGIPYRGRGIPSIHECLQRGDIENLIIITNDVYANVQKGIYKALKNEFRGTFLYWEISK